MSNTTTTRPLSLSEHCLSFLRHPANETVDQVVDRGLRWLQSLIERDELALLEGAAVRELEAARKLLAVRRARQQLELTRRRTGWVLSARLATAERRLSHPLPPSLRRFWAIVGADASLREAVELFTRLKLLTPDAWLQLPAWRAGARRAVWSPVVKGGSHAHDDLAGEYGGWFTNSDPAHQLRRGRDWKKLDGVTPVTLDPAFAPALVRLGACDDEWRHVVSTLRDEVGESPVFCGGDDFESFSTKLGDDCAAWLAYELDTALRFVRAQGEALAVGAMAPVAATAQPRPLR